MRRSKQPQTKGESMNIKQHNLELAGLLLKPFDLLSELEAAAPDLLDIVEFVQKYHLKHQCDHNIQRRMKSAIAKAKGNQCQT